MGRAGFDGSDGGHDADTDSLLGRARGVAVRVEGRYRGSSAEHLWNRLNAMDFVNRGMLFAATLLLCFFPFVIVLNALAGRKTVNGLTRHLGLNTQAANDVSKLFTSTSATSSQVTGTSYVFFVLGGIAAATAVQALYENAYGVDSLGMKDVPRRLVWLAALLGCSFFVGWAGPSVHRATGPVGLAIAGLMVAFLFWWFTLWFLLAGRVHWRELVPGAVATALFWVGMEIVFSLILSNEIISDDKKYGPVGVVFALMSWFIAIGVVIILGAVVGIVWRERQLSMSSEFRRVLHGSSRHAPASGDRAGSPPAAVDHPPAEAAAEGNAERRAP